MSDVAYGVIPGPPGWVPDPGLTPGVDAPAHQGDVGYDRRWYMNHGTMNGRRGDAITPEDQLTIRNFIRAGRGEAPTTVLPTSGKGGRMGPQTTTGYAEQMGVATPATAAGSTRTQPPTLQPRPFEQGASSVPRDVGHVEYDVTILAGGPIIRQAFTSLADALAFVSSHLPPLGPPSSSSPPSPPAPFSSEGQPEQPRPLPIVTPPQLRVATIAERWVRGFIR